jgi:hypothetical protein
MKDQLLVTQAAFSIVDIIQFVYKYGARDFAMLNAAATTGKAEVAPQRAFKKPGEPPEITALKLPMVQNLKNVIPDPVSC